MKQYLIALALMFTLTGSAAGIQPRHRHHTPVAVADSARQDDIEVYSDTSSTDLAAVDDSSYTATTLGTQFDDDDVERFLHNLLDGTIGAGAVVIVILIFLFGLLIVLAPFITVILIIRYFINRNNNRVKLAQKAMETGQPIPEDLKPTAPETPEYYKEKGIKNIALGLGLCIMFSMWDARMLAGVGLLIMCWGIGQVVIAKNTK